MALKLLCYQTQEVLHRTVEVNVSLFIYILSSSKLAIAIFICCTKHDDEVCNVRKITRNSSNFGAQLPHTSATTHNVRRKSCISRLEFICMQSTFTSSRIATIVFFLHYFVSSLATQNVRNS